MPLVHYRVLYTVSFVHCREVQLCSAVTQAAVRAPPITATWKGIPLWARHASWPLKSWNKKGQPLWLCLLSALCLSFAFRMCLCSVFAIACLMAPGAMTPKEDFFCPLLLLCPPCLPLHTACLPLPLAIKLLL